VTFNTILKGCAQQKLFDQAFKIFNVIKKSSAPARENCDGKSAKVPSFYQPNDVTYNSMIDVCVRCNRMDTAWQLLAEMEQVGLKPDNFTYSTLIKGI
jgi:pentatricopeptide repeat protein